MSSPSPLPTRRARSPLRRLIGLVPRPVLLILALGAIGWTGWHLVRFVRFEREYRRAVTAVEQEEYEKAGEHLGQCVRLAPESSRAHFLAGRVARLANQLDLAGEELTAAADLGWPAEAVQLERLMATVQKTGLTDDAEVALRGHLDANNLDRYLVLDALAQGAMRSYRLTPALGWLTEWIEGRPNSLAARMKRGWVYERLGRFEDAEADYRAALTLQADHRPAQVRLGMVLIQQGKYAEAVPILEPLQAGRTDATVEAGLAKAYAALGRGDDARRLFLALNTRRPTDPTPALELGKLDLAKGEPAAAREWFVQAIGRAPEEYEPHYQMFLTLKQLGDNAGAAREEKKFKEIEADLRKMADLTEKLQSKPNDPSLRFQIAEIFFRRGESTEGALWLEQVLKLDPGHRKARDLLAEHYERSGRPDRARNLRAP